MKTTVICSGGLDSVSLAHMVAREHTLTRLVSFDYGQRHRKELDFAALCAARLNVPDAPSVPLSHQDLLVLKCLMSRPGESVGHREIAEALGVQPVEVLGTNQLFVVLDSEQAVRECRPDMAALAKLPWLGAIVTARGDRHDFVSRFFAPAIGINEDPVTGSAHTSLAPFWAERLGKSHLTAEQGGQRKGTQSGGRGGLHAAHSRCGCRSRRSRQPGGCPA